MSESDLDNILDDLELPDGESGEGEGESMEIDPDLAAALGGGDEEAGAEGGGEGMDIDPDLEAALGGGGEEGGEGVDIDPDLASALGDSDFAGGDDEMDVDVEAELNAMSGGGGGGGGGAAAAAPAPGNELAHIDPTAGGLVGEEAVVNIEFLLDVKLHVTFEVGRAKMLISDLLTLGQGSVIELHRLVGDELDLLINGKLVAKGEVVVVNEKFGCRISSIVPPEERINHLGGV